MQGVGPFSKAFFSLHFLFLLFNVSYGLSWPLCDNGGQVWVTQRPRVADSFPGADLWLFCDAGINILGASVAACVPNPNATVPLVCGDPITEALCQLLGYEKSFPQDTTIALAAPDEPVVTLTGQYCVREGDYRPSLPPNDTLPPLPGTPCNKIQKLTCLRTLNTMSVAARLGLSKAENLTVLQPTPAAENMQKTAYIAQQQAMMQMQQDQEGGQQQGR